MAKKTAVAPLKKKEPKYTTLYLCFDPNEWEAYLFEHKDETLSYPYYIEVRVVLSANKPTVNLGTITLPT